MAEIDWPPNYDRTGPTERCSRCGNLKLDYDVEVLGEVKK